MRYAKSTKSAIAAALTGLLGGNILMLICGAIATIAMNDYDLTNILLGFGLVIPSLILMTTNIFTTNAANLYSTGLNLANAFKLGRSKMMIILIAISAVLTLTRPYQVDFFYTFLNVLGNVVPPWPASSSPTTSWSTRASTALWTRPSSSSGISYPGSAGPSAWPSCSWCPGPALLNGIVLGALFHTVLMLVTKQRWPRRPGRDCGGELI